MILIREENLENDLDFFEQRKKDYEKALIPIFSKELLKEIKNLKKKLKQKGLNVSGYYFNKETKTLKFKVIKIAPAQ